MYTNEINEWLNEARLEEKDSGSGIISSFDEIGVDDNEIDPEQVIITRGGISNYQNGITTSPM